MLILFERFFLWIASFAGTKEAAGVLPEASWDVMTQMGNVEAPTLPGWFFGLMILAATVLAVAFVLILGKGRLGNLKITGKELSESRDVRRESEGLFALLWKRLKKRVIFVYRFVFHPEDIRVLVDCALRLGELSEQYYYSGKMPEISREEGEFLRKKFGG